MAAHGDIASMGILAKQAQMKAGRPPVEGEDFTPGVPPLRVRTDENAVSR